MKTAKLLDITTTKGKFGLLVSALTLMAAVFGTQSGGQVSAAACAAPATDYGSATTQVNIPAAGTYRVWSRMKAAEVDENFNSYSLEIDGNTCFDVGGGAAGSIPKATWTWVDFHGGNAAQKVNHNFTTAGNHTIKLIGREAAVRLDRVIFTQDAGCTPTDKGDNCANPPDTTNPTAQMTAPAANATVVGRVDLSATATDNVAVQKVEFRIDGVIVGEDTTGTSNSYTFNWDSRAVGNGTHTVSARAYDAAGNNITSNTVTINVQNPPQFSCVGITAILCDAFSTPDEDGIYDFAAGGSWNISGGKLVLSNPAPAPNATAVGNFNLALHQTTVSGNWDYNVKAKVTGTDSTFDDFSVVFNYQNQQNYYFVSINESNDANTLGFFKIQNGVQTQLADFLGTGQANKDYEMRISRRGNVYEVYADGQKLNTVTDATFTSGKVGVGSRNNAAEFDDLYVTAAGTTTPGDTQAPTVSITAPAGGANLGTATTNISANAADNVGVTKVEFYIDGQLLGIDNTPPQPFVFPVNPSTLTNGTHSLTAKAFDAAGNSTTSSPISVTVNIQTFDAADVNQDGRVNIADLSAVLAKYGQVGGDLGRSDVNGDGRVNIADLSAVLAKYGQGV